LANSPHVGRLTRQEAQVSEQTIYVWRKHFAGMAPADVKRLKALELENAKLKRLLAERDRRARSDSSRHTRFACASA